MIDNKYNEYYAPHKSSGQWGLAAILIFIIHKKSSSNPIDQFPSFQTKM